MTQPGRALGRVELKRGRRMGVEVEEPQHGVGVSLGTRIVNGAAHDVQVGVVGADNDLERAGQPVLAGVALFGVRLHERGEVPRLRVALEDVEAAINRVEDEGEPAVEAQRRGPGVGGELKGLRRAIVGASGRGQGWAVLNEVPEGRTAGRRVSGEGVEGPVSLALAGDRVDARVVGRDLQRPVAVGVGHDVEPREVAGRGVA